jgi:magnesium transporter
MRGSGPDYLAYAIIDAVVDQYFPALEAQADRLDELEDAVLGRPGREVAVRILEAKRELLTVRRVVWPLREEINTLLRDATGLVSEETKIFLRDTYDHTIQIMDLVETYRELAAGMTDLYLSSLSQRTNETMRLLTIISTIFIPLSFIASVYGMNFDTAASPWNLPELGWAFGYPFVLALMLAVAVGLVAFFWRRGWLAASEWTLPARDETAGEPGSDAGTER